MVIRTKRSVHMSEQKNEKQGNVKNTKKKRKESLILKYGSIAFFEILTIISLFLWYNPEY